MADNFANFAARLHQFLNDDNYEAFRAEAEGYLETAPHYLIAKWSIELKKKGFPPDIDSGGEENTFYLLTEDEFSLTSESGDNIITE